jgi:hypothetical protein
MEHGRIILENELVRVDHFESSRHRLGVVAEVDRRPALTAARRNPPGGDTLNANEGIGMDHYDAGSKSSEIDALTLKVLKVFGEMGSETLDLHTLFDAGGNDPHSRERVLDVITRLVDAGLLEPRGSDFYSLTDKGHSALRTR